MSSSDESEGETFQLRSHGEDTDDERPNKRRKTAGKPLWGKGMSFVSSAVSAQIEDQNTENEEEEDVDDERPSMGMGSVGGFRSGFNIGEYSAATDQEESPPPAMGTTQPTQPIGAGSSAFGPGGKMNKNSFAARMMAKQGYVEGQGLGKHGQGISAPIQAQVLQSRAGLGTGSAQEPPRRQKADRGKPSKPSTPGTHTPRIRAPPKTKYTVAAIESRGLHVPEAMKSIIIDATGTENKTISSVSASGFSTPVREQSPGTIQRSKTAARIKLQLSAYAESWDSYSDAETGLDNKEVQLAASIALHDEEERRYGELITAFERVTADDSAQQRSWDDVVARLGTIQTTYEPYIDDLDLSILAISCLEPPFRAALSDWEPLTDPTHLVDSLESLSSLLQLSKLGSRHPRKRTTPFESLLLQYWFPRIRSSLQHEWSIYDPVPAVTLLNAWKPCLPSWFVAKVCNEIILPRLMEGARRFPKRAAEQKSATYSSANGTSMPKRSHAPELHAWLFDWWSLLSSPELDLELFPELRREVKSKVTSEVWPKWKLILGSSSSKKPKTDANTHATTKPRPRPEVDAVEDKSFREMFEEWCAENDLLLQSTGRSDGLGRLLYRLTDVRMRGKGQGLLVYWLDGVVFDSDHMPWGLDHEFVERVRSSA